MASGLVWCDICEKYCTHTTENCYQRNCGPNQHYQQPSYDQRAYQNQGYPNQENPMVGGNVANVDKPVPILGTQPPLPRAIAVRYVDVALDEGANPQ